MMRALALLAALAACAPVAEAPAPVGVDVAFVDAPGATVTVWEVPGDAPGSTTAIVWITEGAE
jgi:hypothetical protein